MLKNKISEFIRLCHLPFAKNNIPNNIALLFHNIEERNLPEFIKILHYFQDLGYKSTNPITYQEINDEKKIFISFDDNYKNWINISEILSKNNYQAVFYTNTLPLNDKSSELIRNAYYDRINYHNDREALSSKDIHTMHFDFNQIIGGHTTSHLNLTKVSMPIAKDDILSNKNELEEIIGQKILHFSFPYGMRRHFNQKLREYCKEIGYETICNGIPGLLNEKNESLNISRTRWNFEIDFKHNLDNLRIQGAFFEKITGRSAIG